MHGSPPPVSVCAVCAEAQSPWEPEALARHDLVRHLVLPGLAQEQAQWVRLGLL